MSIASLSVASICWNLVSLFSINISSHSAIQIILLIYAPCHTVQTLNAYYWYILLIIFINYPFSNYKITFRNDYRWAHMFSTVTPGIRISSWSPLSMYSVTSSYNGFYFSATLFFFPFSGGWIKLIRYEPVQDLWLRKFLPTCLWQVILDDIFFSFTFFSHPFLSSMLLILRSPCISSTSHCLCIPQLSVHFSAIIFFSIIHSHLSLSFHSQVLFFFFFFQLEKLPRILFPSSSPCTNADCWWQSVLWLITECQPPSVNYWPQPCPWTLPSCLLLGLVKVLFLWAESLK